MFNIVPCKIIGVQVFLEFFKTRIPVGILKEENDGFEFCYDDKYLKHKAALPLGVEFPLTQKKFCSKEMFPTFLDRIPDKDNPAYKDYCTQALIPVTVTDPIVLVSTIGKRGPSSFIFEPIFKNDFSWEIVESFMSMFNLSVNDLATIFGVSPSIISKIKAGKSSGKEVMNLLEIVFSSFESLHFILQKNGASIHPKKIDRIYKFINSNFSLYNSPTSFFIKNQSAYLDIFQIGYNRV